MQKSRRATHERRHPMTRGKSHFTPFQWDDALRFELASCPRTSGQSVMPPRLLPGQAVPARADGEPRGEIRSRDHERDGRDGLPRRHAGGLWLRRRQLRRLRPDLPRGRAGRLRLPLGDERAVVAGDVSDLRVRLRRAAAEVPAEAAQRRDGRLLRPDRAGCRLRPGVDAHAGEAGRRRLRAERRQDVDHQSPDRRCAAGLGQGRAARSAASWWSAAWRA